MKEEQQEKVITYRGIKLANSVKLYMKNGEFNLKIQSSLDKLVDKLNEYEITLLEKYLNSFTTIKAVCKGHEIKIKPSKVVNRGDRCSFCSINSKIRAKEHLIELLKENDHNWIDGEYINAHGNILVDFKCIHDPQWVRINDYKNGHWCKECGKKKRPVNRKNKSKEELVKLIEKNDHEWFEGEYLDSNTKIRINYKCGHEPHWVTPNHYKTSGVGCPDCYELYMRGQNIAKERGKENFILAVKKNKHEWVEGEYKSSKDKVRIDYKCGHEPHWITPGNYINDIDCPHCSESKGEKVIREYLESEGIKHKTQFMFPGFSRKYDFMIYELKTIVEVHGRQHYEEGYLHELSGKTLAKEQENDREKEDYAMEMGYTYIIVDYREHIPKLALKKFIKSYTELMERKNKQQKV